MLHRHWDPRRNPSLRPHEWENAIRRTRMFLMGVAGLLIGGLIALAVYFWYPFDRTKNLSPETLAQSAGMALLDATGYRFKVELVGESADNLFPNMSLNGEYQRSPQVVHLGGEVKAGESKVGLEYYLEGSNLFVKQPTTPNWLLVKDASADEISSFYPDNLAAPFISGVRKAKLIGRGKLPQGEAVELQLDLDPNVMLPNQPALQADKAEYTIWVLTRNLRPARITIKVVPSQASGEQERQATYFAYTLDLDFTKLSPVAVPAAVKAKAELVEESGKDRSLLPPKPSEPKPSEPKPTGTEETKPDHQNP